MAVAKKNRRREAHLVREKPEFDQEVLDVRRTARVVAGGRRFSFRATVAVGDGNGRIGLGVGKGTDVSMAVEKGAFRGKKRLFAIPLTASKTIPHAVFGKVSAGRIILKPAREGQGLRVGGPIRKIARLAGIRNLSGKILGRTVNALNNAQAAIAALKHLKNRQFSPMKTKQSDTGNGVSDQQEVPG
jgi:small subunit ribosomal protein S5